MRTVHQIQKFSDPPDASIVSIGNFDGIHRGHQEILRCGRALADEKRVSLAAVTFDPHPLRMVAPERAPATLMPLHEKLRCLQLAGVNLTVVLPSKTELLAMTPESFIEELILPALHPLGMVEGRSFGFGRNRSGDVETLLELGSEFGFEVVVVPPVNFLEDESPERVSSSLVRRLIGEGRVAAGSRCMGRRYALFGKVVSGRRRGRTLGFPTANLEVEDQLIPGDGVYSGIAFVESAETGTVAAISIGHTPTFNDTGRLIEAHLLDFDGSLEGKTIRLEFAGRVREQRKFSRPEELQAQISEDVRQVRSETERMDRQAGAVVAVQP